MWGFGKFIRRFSVSTRSNLSSKKTKNELNFKEGNEIVNPYDILDRNIPGIDQRLRLYEMRRLREQLILDRPELENLQKKSSMKSNTENKDRFHYEIKYSVASNFPGMNCPSETSFEASVTLFADFKSLGLSKLAVDRIIRILSLNSGAQSLEFSVSNFPLVSQNKTRAVEILRAIIDMAKNIDINDFESFLPSNCEGRLEISGSKLIPEFPQEWLQIKKHE